MKNNQAPHPAGPAPATTTALILRPRDMPPLRVLECDGPERIPRVHDFPGTFVAGYLSFEEWQELPEHAKWPARKVTDYDQARRCARLLAQAESMGNLPLGHLREIQRRLETIHGPMFP